MPCTICVLPMPLTVLLMAPLLLTHYFMVTMTISSSSGTLQLFPVWRWIPLPHSTQQLLLMQLSPQRSVLRLHYFKQVSWTQAPLFFHQTLFISLAILITVCNFTYFACFLIVYLPFKRWALWKWIPPSCSPFHDHFLAQRLAHTRCSINICWLNGWVRTSSRPGS